MSAERRTRPMQTAAEQPPRDNTAEVVRRTQRGDAAPAAARQDLGYLTPSSTSTTSRSSMVIFML
jgi:hypothetical protein